MDDWPGRLSRLLEMPEYLRGAEARIPADRASVRPAPDAFAWVEHVWHLADLEREGFAERIRRLRTEENPVLPDFDGARIARERDYRTRDAADGLAAFVRARAENLAALRSLKNADRARSGLQDGVGTVRLGDVPLRMLEHDASHRREIGELLARLERA